MSDNNGWFICKICNKRYASYNSLWNHNKRFHNNNVKINNNNVKINNNNVKINNDNVKITNDNVKINNKCENCNKIFASRQSKWEHKKNKTCFKLNNNITNNNITNNNITNITNITNNNTIINITNNIVINKIGYEDTVILRDAKIVKKLINGDTINSIIKVMNFNEKIPDNHIFCCTSLEGKYFNVYNTDTKQIDKINKNKFNNTLLVESINKLEYLSCTMEYNKDIKKKYKLLFIKILNPKIKYILIILMN